MKPLTLSIGHLYPDLLNLYGDSGNLSCLQKRLSWRGIQAQIRPFLTGDPIPFAELDLVLLGGGSDREQELACRHLQCIRREFKAYAEDGGVVLAVCGGFQLLGTYYKTSQKTIPGLEILEISTQWAPERLSGNIILDSPLSPRPVVGYENHSGRTFIGSHTPFGSVRTGFGNTGTSGQEGVLYKNVLGTYLHGPLLPRNPDICDNLLGRALARRYGQSLPLSPLPDELEHQANACFVHRFASHRFTPPPVKQTVLEGSSR